MKRPAFLQGVSKMYGSSVIFSPSRRNQNARTCTGGLFPSPVLRNVPLRWHLRIAPTAAIVPLPITFANTKGKMKTSRSPAKPLPCLADRNRRTRTFDTLDISQLLYQLSYVPKSTRPRTWPDGYLVFEESRFMAIRNQTPPTLWAFGFIFIL